jgi:NAD(P)H-nitrite reductase large subunit
LLVCHCRKVCDRTIRECVDRGARSLEEVARACQAGTACGGCIPTIDALIAGEPADAGVVSLGKARVRERPPQVEIAIEIEVEVETDVEIEIRPAVARAS